MLTGASYTNDTPQTPSVAARYDLPINAARIQELAALAAESEAVGTVAEAAQKVFAFDTYGWLASNVLPHLPVPPTFNTSQGAEGMNIQVNRN